jgi:hypothetical protein
MPTDSSQADREFLETVARMERAGVQMQEIAAHLGIANGTLTYRLARLGYVRRTQIVDQRTGQRLSEVFAAPEAVTA